MTGSCTMTYLAGGRSALLHRSETVAPAGTVPGYSPHTVYCPRVGGDISEDVFVRPTTKLCDICPAGLKQRADQSCSKYYVIKYKYKYKCKRCKCKYQYQYMKSKYKYRYRMSKYQYKYKVQSHKTS